MFWYSVGRLKITEQLKPTVRAGGSALIRHLAWRREEGELEGMPFLRVAVGKDIRQDTDGAWIVTGEKELRVRAPVSAFLVAPPGDPVELRVPVRWAPVETYNPDRGSRCVGVGSEDIEYAW